MKELRKKILSDFINQKIFGLAEDLSLSLYLVGGYIRNLLLGIETADKDYIIEGHGAWNFAKILSGVLNGSFVGLDRERDMARVVIDGSSLDFSGTEGKRVEEDLERRDFAINSIAWSPGRGLIDALGGMKDIKDRIIRANKRENMIDDPLRLLRAYRIGAELRMDIEPRTVEMITELAYLLKNVSGERVSSEVFRILESPQSVIYILKASDSGVLETIFPELIPTRDIPLSGNRYSGVFEHSLEVVNQIEYLVSKLPVWVINHLKDDISSGVKRLSVLKLGGILHDVGKPLTWTTTQNKKHRFIGHGRVGADLIEKISDRLRLSNDITRTLKTLVRSHIRPLNLIEHGFPDKKVLFRFFRIFDNDSIDLLILALADIIGMGGDERGIKKKEGILIKILEEFRSYKKKEIEIRKAFTGHDVMKILDLEPGPDVGKLLRKLREAQMTGEISSKKMAIEYLKRLFNKT